ncbi:hypothetical protein DEJ50_06995 [Streptomyces venezuelae]|uniref:Uncharacterized protein n=1 Tax=Streptomyces venezuelae TaxID=54571 RepID=A0A5P2D075_STRVZ|nr:hypothetical protein [Streptomyces venezuelae]QES47607.1 hypothetical protein DEJ50_06995 [Streptomyces venezuelae]
MQKNLAATQSDAAATAIASEDPAGRLTLSGRNKVCARARVLSGMVLTSGIVITLGQLDTSVSFIKAGA